MIKITKIQFFVLLFVSLNAIAFENSKKTKERVGVKKLGSIAPANQKNFQKTMPSDIEEVRVLDKETNESYAGLPENERKDKWLKEYWAYMPKYMQLEGKMKSQWNLFNGKIKQYIIMCNANKRLKQKKLEAAKN